MGVSSASDIANGTLLVSNFMGWAFLFEFGSEFVNLRSISLRFQRFVKFITVALLRRCAGIVYSALSKSGIICCNLCSRFPRHSWCHGPFRQSCRATVGQILHARLRFVSHWLILYALKTATVLPSHFITEYAIQIGSVFQVILLSLALGIKLVRFSSSATA